MELRNYQSGAIDKLRSCMAGGKRRIILQASCGAGKTIISAEIVNKAIEKGKKVLFLVNRRDLIKQTVDKYTEYGLGDEIGIIMAGEEPSLNKPIQCASLQTYTRRLKLQELEWNMWFHNADLIIYDECHSSNAPTYKAILEHYKDKYIIGLSATPLGAAGTGLGTTFQEIVQCVPTSELIEQGFLVPPVHYAPSTPDLTGIGIVAGDYNKKQLGERVNKPKLVGDIYENWARLAGDRSTIIFATNVKHSIAIKQEFEKYGASIAHIDAHTCDEDREDIYKGFERGDIQVLTNVGVCCEGSDLPIASAVVIAKPTLQVGRWIQMGGRGARPYDGKDDFLILDHAGCIERHGLIDDEVEWSLDAKKPAAKKKVVRKKEKTLLTCEECSFVFSGKRCPQCGADVKEWGKKIEAAEAELEEVGKTRTKPATMDDKRRFYGMLEHYRRSKGYKEGWTSHKYKEKFSCWPKGLKEVGPTEPDIGFYNWIKYLNIKAAKKREAENKSRQGELFNVSSR